MSIIRSTAGQAIPLGTTTDLDGAEVTSTDGWAVTVAKDGVSGAAAGTLTFAGGYWYAPTQGETDAAAILVRATRASTVPLSQAVITQDHPRSAIPAAAAGAEGGLPVLASGRVPALVEAYAAGQEPATAAALAEVADAADAAQVAAEAAAGAIGTAGANLTALGDPRLDYLDAAVSSVVPAGAGGNPVTISLVDAAGAPVPGLTVVVWNAAITARLAYGTTGSTGQAVFNLAAGAVRIAVTTGTLWVAVAATAYTVTDTGAQSVPAITLTAQSITPPAGASQITGVLDTYDAQGALEAGVTITLRQIRGPGAAGQSHDTGMITAVSNGSGRVEVALLRGAEYKARRGTTGDEVRFTAPSTGTSFVLPEILGTP